MRRRLSIFATIVVTCMSALAPTLAFAEYGKKGHRGDYGHEVQVLPHRHNKVRVGGRPYYYSDGRYYEPRGRSYFVVNAPIGARIHRLPSNYASFEFGSNRYYYANTTYYLWNNLQREYVVVEKPLGAEEAIQANTEVVEAAELYVYPRSGQTEEQRDQDRYECHRWAKSQTDYDPSLSNQKPGLAQDYHRAISACLEGREYTVK